MLQNKEARKRGNDVKAITHICMPDLSVVGLLVVSRYFKKGSTYFHYGILPRYLRGVVKIFRISPRIIESILSRVAGIPVMEISQGDDVAGYNDFHIGTQEQVSVIAEALIPLIENDPWFPLLEKLLGREPALSYALKQIADGKIFQQLIASISCCVSLGDSVRCMVVWDCGWPVEWLNVIKRNTPYAKLDFFQWPNWYLTAANGFFALSTTLEIIWIGFGAFRRCKGGKIKNRKHYKIITEFIDPRRLNNTCYDADYWVDEKNISKKDILFFLTNDQKRMLQGIGYKITKTISDVRSKGYDIQLIDTMTYPWAILKEYSGHSSKIMGKAVTADKTILAEMIIKALKEYLSFYPLFYHYSADNFIYLTFPNGHSGLRYNSGIITGLCRKNSVRSIGCQTRAVHSKNYEYVFDSFDLHFAWGNVWHEMMGSSTLFIRKCIVTGCTYFDYLLPAAAAYKTAHQNSNHKRLNVCIFPGDISPRHHYSLNYAISFMVNCARLAVDNPDIDFVVKNKEPQYTDTICASEAFMDIYRQTDGNFRFEDRPRHDYMDLLCSSDIIIAVGFTTPGFEALMLNKRIIYYNELKYGGQAYRELPDSIARNDEELADLFKKAVNDYEMYAENIAEVLKSLDPFRDGRARERICGILIGK
jgi:hypothetical protein